MQPKIAFYPCCALDIQESIEILIDIVDEIVFCDNNKSLIPRWNKIVNQHPKLVFECEDVLVSLESISKIDVLFYRNDSGGEGGSGLYILGKKLLHKILNKFPSDGGLIITDGSNSGSKIFKRMIRPNGYVFQNKWHLRPSNIQPFLNTYNLFKIEVSTINNIPE